jgi:hypothetical protein
MKLIKRILIVCITCSPLFPKAVEAYKRFPSTVTTAELEAVNEIDVAFGRIDQGSSGPSPSLQAGVERELQKALKGSSQFVKVYALDQLVERMTGNCSFVQVSSGLTNILLEADSSPRNEKEVERRVKRVKWLVNLCGIEGEAARIDYLGKNVTNLTDGYFYAFTSMQALANLASEESERLLLALVGTSGGKSFDSGLRRMAYVSLSKVKVLRAANKSDPSKQVEVIAAALTDPSTRGGVIGARYRIWLVELLRGLGPVAAPTLRKVREDPSQPATVRSSAGTTPSP